MGFYQVILTLASVYQVDFSSLPEYQVYMNYFRWVDLRIFKFFSLDFLGPWACMGSFQDLLIWKTIIPILLLVLLLVLGTLIGMCTEAPQDQSNVDRQL